MGTWEKRIVRRLVPRKVRSLINSSYFFRRAGFFVRRRSFLRYEDSVKYESSPSNIYHCCVQKTASQWVHRLLFDRRIYIYSGLVPYIYRMPYAYELPFNVGYDATKSIDGVFLDPFPGKTIVGPLYTSFEAYMAIPKPEQYKTFFVMRDPRDIVVSWYFSTKYSHAPMKRILELREILNSMPIQDGILYSIDALGRSGLFRALESWASAMESSQDVLVIRFEDITGPDQRLFFEKLLSHCDICMPDDVLDQLLEDYSFEKLSGRRQGQEDTQAHFRKGISGDWKNYFDDVITAKFREVTEDLVTKLGYNW